MRPDEGMFFFVLSCLCVLFSFVVSVLVSFLACNNKRENLLFVYVDLGDGDDAPEFDVHESLEAVCASKFEPDLTKLVLLFSVDQAKPRNIVVPRGAPRAPKSSLGITVLTAFKFDQSSRSIRVHLEGRDGGNDRSYRLTPEIFTRDDLWLVRSWSPKRLEMHFGSVDRLEGSIASSELAQRVITEMVQKNSLDEPYICHTVEHAKEIEILEQLKTHRLVETDSTLSSKTAGLVGDQSRWVLAAGAFSQLRIVQALFSKQKQNKCQAAQHKKRSWAMGRGSSMFPGTWNRQWHRYISWQ